MNLYVKCQRNGQNNYVSYFGQDQDTVTRLLTELGATDIEFVTEEEYQEGVASQQP